MPQRYRDRPPLNECLSCGAPCRRRWCSQSCNAASRRRYTSKVCRRCGCEFQVRQSEVDRGHGIYCSEACRRSYEFENAKNYPKIGRKAIHRTVASESIGRPLKAGEIVHHKDENKLNCDPGNLEVLASQAEHMALHAKRGEESAFAKLDWAKVGEIRRRSAEGETPAVLADEFHVDPSNIRLIVKRKTWK